MTNAPEIRLESLTVGYGSTPIVSDMNILIPGGKITVIVGGSGCGKSTLLKHILRLHHPMQGTVYIGGHDLFSMSGKAFQCLRQRMGALFQDGALLGSLRIKDNVALPLREHTRLKEKEIAEIVLHKLELVGLGHATELFPHELSGGMRKRAGLARALVMDPQVLVCDEPTSGLDPVMSADLDQLLLEMMDHFHMTTVVVSHDLASMRTIADHVVVLGDGRCLFQGSVEALETQQDEYLRSFLDRKAPEQQTSRLTMPALDPSVMKLNCAQLLGEE